MKKKSIIGFYNQEFCKSIGTFEYFQGLTGVWMERLVCGIGVFSMAIGAKSFERGIKLSSEREKLRKSYWIFVIFFARICY